jgi:hypothetical protein
MQASLNADSNANVTMTGTGTVTLPNIPLTPIGGQVIGSGNGYLRYKNGPALSHSFIMCWGVAPVVGTLGVEIAFDGSYHIITNDAQVQQYLVHGA